MARTHDTYVDGVLESEVPYTMTEEIVADAGDYFKDITEKTAGETLPEDYDDWKTKYDPDKAVDALLTAEGLDPKTIDPDLKKVMKILFNFGYQACIFMHGTPPGIPKQ